MSIESGINSQVFEVGKKNICETGSDDFSTVFSGRGFAEHSYIFLYILCIFEKARTKRCFRNVVKRGLNMARAGK